LFGVKSRANVGERGGAPVTLRLLLRIKALFEPKPAPPVTEQVQAQIPEPIAAFEPTPDVEAPTLLAEAPTLVREAPTIVEEAPPVLEKAPPVLEKAPPVPDETPPVLEEVPVAAEEPPTVLEEVTPDAHETVPVVPAGGITLRLESERGPRSTFEVTKSGATIGRGPESTIQLADLSVSRKHAKITYKQGAYWLSDLGSMGGTWIDGTKLAAPRRVATGQTIDIGLCRLTVVAAAEGEKSGAAKGPSNAA
jgi:hypothetical protein